ncbi:glycosyltransferase family 61 protein [Chryseobacterium indologenes]|uniref:Glycosyltransferase family 61 protein n=1 Tax=Chryseobacterium indologenes TaxID=253 RepID=A0A411DR26_CHRID|nr:glycosyltransferase family 61 protein [Chryseobacterium indologenes]
MATVIGKFVSYIKSNESLSGYFKKTVYNYKYSPTSQIVTIKDIETCKENIIQKLYSKTIFKNYVPKSLNDNEHYIETSTPEISVYLFKDALIDIHSSAVLMRNQLITYRSKDERFNEGFVTAHDGKNAKVDLKKIEELEEGFFLGGNGSWNWFHYLIEIMPKLIVFDKRYCQTILVNDIVLKIPSMKKILEILTENKFNIHYLSPDKSYRVKELYHINDFNHVPFNRFDKLIKAEGTFYNLGITRRFSHLISEKLSLVESLPEKIFLYRKNTHRVAENQDQILEYLKKFGFVPIYLEELNIEDQASYFKNAKFIVGISGAAWSNMLFCENNPKSICFIPDNAREFSVFSNLAKIFEVDFYTQLYSNDGVHTNSNFIINFEQFVELFNYVYGKH